MSICLYILGHIFEPLEYLTCSSLLFDRRVFACSLASFLSLLNVFMTDCWNVSNRFVDDMEPYYLDMVSKLFDRRLIHDIRDVDVSSLSIHLSIDSGEEDL